MTRRGFVRCVSGSTVGPRSGRVDSVYDTVTSFTAAAAAAAAAAADPVLSSHLATDWGYAPIIWDWEWNYISWHCHIPLP